MMVLGLWWLPMVPAVAIGSEPDPRIAAEIDDTLARLSDMGALQPSGSSGRLVVEREAMVRYQLGAVVGIEPGADEMPVLAITPGGDAERMGLQLGDRVLEVNGVRLAHSSDLGRDFVLAVSRNRGKLDVRIRRGATELNLQGTAEAVVVPSYRLIIEVPVDVD